MLLALTVSATVAISAASCGGTYQGSTCREPNLDCEGICVDPETDRRHCGACGVECDLTERCEEGQCTAFCGAGTVLCGEDCVQTDFAPAHCGGCGQACEEGAACENGRCTEICGSTMRSCDGQCVDTRNDPQHCGDCGAACPSGELCSGGRCVVLCSGGTEECGGRCVDFAWDRESCGTCGVICDPGEVCSEGACGSECGGGTERCGDRCVFTESDALNCGACNEPCQEQHVCVAGVCQSDCGAEQSRCGDRCVDLGYDRENCGECGVVCPSDTVCFREQCVVPVLDGRVAEEFETYTPAYQLPSLAAISDFSEDGSFAVAAGDRFFVFGPDERWQRIESFGGVPATGGLAVVDGLLYLAAGRDVRRYDPAVPTTATLATYARASSGTQTVSDGNGGVYYLSSAGRIVRYDLGTRETQPESTGLDDYLPRLAWDTLTARLYIAPRLDDNRLVEYDPVTKAVTDLPRPPNDAIGPMFCSDRSGHLYTRGDAGAEVWQYTVWSREWKQVAEAPFSLHPWAACVVTAERRLYIYSEGDLASVDLLGLAD